MWLEIPCVFTIKSKLTLLVFEIDHSVNNILSQKPLTLKTSQLHGMLVKKGLTEDFPIPNLTTIFFSAANSIFLFNYQMKKQFGIDPFDEKEVEKHADIIVKIFYPNI